jgi:HAD superfamily hydrolase (TIGR01509 family)
MNMTTINAIIFDMDGVIVDSEPLHVQAEHAICEQYGIKAPWSEWDRFKGQTEQEMFAYIVQNFTDGTIAAHELIRTKYDLLLTLFSEKLQPIPGAIPFIRWAKEHYRKLALTTSSERKLQKLIFDRYKLHPYFDVVITGDQIQHSKPHPEPYIKTITSLKLAANICVVIEDSVLGILAAKKAGCKVVGITTSFSEKKLLEAGADVVVNNFSSLYDELRC